MPKYIGHGRCFTWSNERERPTLEKLDRVLVTMDWESEFLNCFLQALPTMMSDHCPLLLSSNAGLQGKPRYHFAKHWTKLPDYLQVVEQAWTCDVTTADHYRRLDTLLHNATRELQSWGQRKVGSIKLQILAARELIMHLDRAQERRVLSEEELELRRELKKKSLGLASLEHTIARAQSRNTWLRDGDASTKFFHLHASYRKKKNHITSLESNKGPVHDHNVKQELLFQHFQAIMGTEVLRTEMVELAAIGVPTKALDHLDHPFTEEELWDTIKALPRDKSPGLDRFTAEFYQSAWHIIKEDLMLAINALNRRDTRGFYNLNNALITLLPKKPKAQRPGDYRPICLIHSFAKIATNMMARRVAPELHDLVDVNQSAFIKSRSIHDNFKFVQAAARLFKQRRIPKLLLLKLDIAKAFDTVSWPFLLQILQHAGFGPRWRDWTSILLSTASTRVLLNGIPGKQIRLARGLRQGDPLSPLLFLLVMDVFHRMITHAASNQMLQPIGHRGITHQCSLYADDTVLFLAPTEQDLTTTVALLSLFGNASGLRTNLDKCIVAPISCSDEDIDRTSPMLPCQLSDFPITYLGMPLSTGKLRKEHLQSVLDKVTRRIPT